MWVADDVNTTIDTLWNFGSPKGTGAAPTGWRRVAKPARTFGVPHCSMWIEASANVVVVTSVQGTTRSRRRSVHA